ncbi:unnamed protein product (macronuclear) [Paramecium tetraurelia]|uniref:cDENN domain-containing protein n=1 Tax=Paramecium tetraurelia TaxID=5888 RepID=A0CAN0_PARTE|nr:uncharacterized protein GSPATT00036628001 [Paramecium tetraurelia]CAK67847.1 unnamed protein product [Paramecium tetraurelia]|eukprot:XP_001435244.1 hypothetical protein (macronuclear) [Paramecium tetraurelia strain d4-2]
MKNLEQENEKLRKAIKDKKQQISEANTTILQYQNSIEEYDQEKQTIIQDINELINKKDKNFDKRIKGIIERLPCQIEQKSLQYLTKSIINKGLNVLNDLNIAYKNAYKEEYNKSQDAKPQPLIESYFIIILKHKDITDLQKEETILKPKFLYQLCNSGWTSKERESWVDYQKDIITHFDNNYVVVERLDDISKIQNLITKCLNKQDVLQENSFIFNLQGSSFDEQVPKNIELLASVNPNKQLFAFVQGVDDYITSFSDEGFSYWPCKKYYCFLTYFPIPEIFDQLLKFASNLIQASRLEAIIKYQDYINQRLQMTLEEKNEYNQKIYQDIDAVNIHYRVESIMEECIKLLMGQYLDFDKPSINVDLQSKLPNTFNVTQKTLIYSLPIQQRNMNIPENLKQIRYEIVKNNNIKYAHVVQQIFNFDTFIKIFQEILKEGNIVFYCQNLYILTSVCYFFHQIIYPFIWFDAAIYYSNREKLNILVEKGRFIIGINTTFYNNKANQKIIESKNLMIVDLKIKQEKEGFKVQPIIHQNKPGNIGFSVLTRQFFQIKQLLKDENVPASIFQYCIDANQAAKCRDFLECMMKLIQNWLIDRIVPDADPDFTMGGWNDGFIKQVVKNRLKDDKDIDFILEYIYISNYFQKYLKSKYNYNDPN